MGNALKSKQWTWFLIWLQTHNYVLKSHLSACNSFKMAAWTQNQIVLDNYTYLDNITTRLKPRKGVYVPTFIMPGENIETNRKMSNGA